MNFVSAMQGLVVILWIIIIGLIVIMAIRASRGVKSAGCVAFLIGLLVVTGILTILSVGLVFIKPEDRGVVISALSSTGYRQDPLTPGLHLIIPFFERVERYKITHQTYTMSSTPTEGRSTGATIQSSPHLRWTANLARRLGRFTPCNPAKVSPASHSSGRTATRTNSSGPRPRHHPRYGLPIHRRRSHSTRRARDGPDQDYRIRWPRKLAENGLVLDDFVLRNITFSTEYAASVEQKQIAEQQAQQAKLVVEQRKPGGRTGPPDSPRARRIPSSSGPRASGCRLIAAEAEARRWN